MFSLLGNVAGEEGSTTEVPAATNFVAFYGFVKFIGPIAILALIWGQRGLLAKFILQINNTYLSTLCPSYSRRERILQWTRTRLPVPLGSRPGNFTNILWKNGYFMCALINSAVPGACSNPHRHWGKPPSHAQALAYKYLGIPPKFTHEDFENKSSVNEKRLLQYIHMLQQTIAKLPVQYDIDNMPLRVKWTSQFSARGMGLVTAEQHRKATFYIYPKVNFNIVNVSISIRGPYNTVGTTSIPSIKPQPAPKRESLSDSEANETKTKIDLNSFLGNPRKTLAKCYTFDFGLFARTNIKQEPACEIPIKTCTEHSRVKITYIPRNTGIHQICLVSNGSHLQGSPHNVLVEENISGKVDDINEQDFQVHRRRTSVQRRFRKARVVSKIIDFVSEKLLLKDDGSFESLTPSPPITTAEPLPAPVAAGSPQEDQQIQQIAELADRPIDPVSIESVDASVEENAKADTTIGIAANDIKAGVIKRCTKVRFVDYVSEEEGGGMTGAVAPLESYDNERGPSCLSEERNEDDETMVISNGTTNDVENCDEPFIRDLTPERDMTYNVETEIPISIYTIDTDQNCNYTIENADENLNYTHKDLDATAIEEHQIKNTSTPKHTATCKQNGNVLKEVEEEFNYSDHSKTLQTNARGINIYKYFPEYESRQREMQTNFHVNDRKCNATLTIDDRTSQQRENRKEIEYEDLTCAADNAVEVGNETSYLSCNKSQDDRLGEDVHNVLDSYSREAKDSCEENSWESYENLHMQKVISDQQPNKTTQQLESTSDLSESLLYSGNESDASYSLNVRLNSQNVIFHNRRRSRDANYSDEFFVVPPIILTNAFTKEELRPSRRQQQNSDHSGYESEESPVISVLQNKKSTKHVLNLSNDSLNTSHEEEDETRANSISRLIENFDNLSNSSVRSFSASDSLSRKEFAKPSPKPQETYIIVQKITDDVKPESTRDIKKLITQFESKSPLSHTFHVKARQKMEAYSKPTSTWKSPDVVACHSPTSPTVPPTIINKTPESAKITTPFTYPICPEHITRNQVMNGTKNSANGSRSKGDSNGNNKSVTERRRCRLQRSFATMSEDASMDEEGSISEYAPSTVDDSDRPNSSFDIEEDDSFDGRDLVDLKSIFHSRQQYWQKLSSRSLDSLRDGTMNRTRLRTNARRNDLTETNRSTSCDKFNDRKTSQVLEAEGNKRNDSHNRRHGQPEKEEQKFQSNLTRRGSASLLNLLLERRSSSSAKNIGSSGSETDEGEVQDLHFQRESFKLMNIEERKAALFPRKNPSQASSPGREEHLSEKDSNADSSASVTPHRLPFHQPPERDADISSSRITTNKCNSNCRLNNGDDSTISPPRNGGRVDLSDGEVTGSSPAISVTVEEAATTSATGFSVKEMTLFFENSCSKPHQAISHVNTSTPDKPCSPLETYATKLTPKRTHKALTKAPASFVTISNNNGNNNSNAINPIRNQITSATPNHRVGHSDAGTPESKNRTKIKEEKGKENNQPDASRNSGYVPNETGEDLATTNPNLISSFSDAVIADKENKFDTTTKKRFAKAKLFFEALETVSMLSLSNPAFASSWSPLEDFCFDCRVWKSHSFAGRRRSTHRYHHLRMGAGKIGGSLKERFDVAGLFEDVIRDKCNNTSFKGIANKHRVAESLASFSSEGGDAEYLNSTTEEEAAIPDYEYFKKRLKSGRRQRRSVFDVKFAKVDSPKDYWNF